MPTTSNIMLKRKYMKVKDAFYTGFETTIEEEEALAEMHYKTTLNNVAYLVVKHGKDAVIAEIDAYLALKDIKGD
jgi:hypothetical protein|tara:strand:+ start:423 stop:647 length:225 start_codon:yes stop_codon:yes gene_type:complete